MDSLGQVADFAALIPTASIPSEVNARTSLILADCIGRLQRGGARAPVDHRPTPRPSRRCMEEYAYYTSIFPWACSRGG